MIGASSAFGLSDKHFCCSQKEILNSFIAGQPLGRLLASVRPITSYGDMVGSQSSQGFDEYAVLGDEVLICDQSVALKYREILYSLGVSISESKSLVSNIGCTKRFLDLRLDLSPISARCLSNFYHPYGIYAIHQMSLLKRFSMFCRISGVGYKNLGSIQSGRSPKIERLRTYWTKSKLPLELWLGGGTPLNPYVKAEVIRYLRVKLNTSCSSASLC